MTESDHKKAYQELMEKKTFRIVVIHFAIKICFYQICGRYIRIRCYVLPVISDNLYTNQAGGLDKSRGRKERALQAKVLSTS